MSTATRFGAIGPFPSCVPEHSPGIAYVGGLSLSDVMAFFWNIETFTLTTSVSVSLKATAGATPPAGTGYSIAASGNVVASPAGVTGSWSPATNYVRTLGAMFTGVSSAIGATSCQPKNRVCSSTLSPSYLIFATSASGSGSPPPRFEVSFNIVQDPTTAGLYAVEYEVSGTNSTSHDGATLQVVFGAYSPAGGPGVLINSGSFTVAGISFPYWCYFVYSYPSNYNNLVTSGGTITASSTLFTY